MKWKLKQFLFAQARSPASPALLRLYQGLPPHRDLAGAWCGFTLCWGLCSPVGGQEQLLMLQSALGERGCLLIKLLMELSIGVNNTLAHYRELKGLTMHSQLKSYQMQRLSLLTPWTCGNVSGDGKYRVFFSSFLTCVCKCTRVHFLCNTGTDFSLT